MTESSNPRPNPYIGPHPFTEGDAHLFFGRDYETRELLDLLLAERIVLLHSPSGAGKSSLIRAGLMPKLAKDEGFHVWPPVLLSRAPGDAGGEGRNRYIEATLLSLGKSAAEWHGTTPGGLLEVLEAASETHTSQFEILIFDQFEEILSLERSDFEAKKQFFREVGQALKADHRWALFAMREEYLAALQPYLKSVPTRLKTTFRLDLLQQEQAALAIREPPARTQDVEFTGNALSRLIDDLRGATGLGSGSRYVEPVLLQVVCFDLWEKLNADDQVIDVGMLDRTSDIDEALENYYERAVVAAATESEVPGRVIRDWFECELISPEGIRKQVLQGPGKDPDQRAKAVERLIQAHVVRCDPRGEHPWLELAHDRLVQPVLRRNEKWRDEFLEPFQQQALVWDKESRPASQYLLTRAEMGEGEAWRSSHGGEANDLEIAYLAASQARFSAQRRRQLGVLSLVLVLVALFFLEGYRRDRAVQRRATIGELAPLKDMPEAERVQFAEERFDRAAGYLLLRRRGSKRLEDLQQLLLEFEELQPPGYGIDVSGLRSVSIPKSPWPLVLDYSTQRQLDWYYFLQSWQSLARVFAESWGIPVPRWIRLGALDSFPKSLVRLRVGEGPGSPEMPGSRLEFETPTREGLVFLTTRGLPAPGREFFERFRADWQEIEEIATGGPWYVVPRWSLPAWKVSGITSTDGSGLLALLLARELQKNPGPLLSDDAVELLLNRISGRYLHTVAEARAARGPRLRTDLVEVVKLGRDLHHLDLLLDALARYPDASSEDAAIWADEDVQASIASLPEAIRGPRTSLGTEGTQEAEGSPAEPHAAYGEVEPWLPAVPDAIRVYVGRSLEKAWYPGDELDPTLKRALETLRDEVVRRFGVEIPGLSFRRSFEDPSVPDLAFRIEALNQSASSSALVHTTLEEAFDDLVEELRFVVYRLRIYWVRADDVFSSLSRFNPALRSWLVERYSLTDLKLILRAVIDPEIEELELLSILGGIGWLDMVPAHHTTRHLDWLLGSLVFWSQSEGSRDVRFLANQLRRLQMARLEDAPLPVSRSPAAVNVDRGLRLLGNGEPDAAQSAFSSAIAEDQYAAEVRFLAAYPSVLYPHLEQELSGACTEPTDPVLTRRQRLNLEELLQGSVASPDSRRSLTLCLLASHPEHWREKRTQLVEELLLSHGDPAKWLPSEAAWLGQQVLNAFDPLGGESGEMDLELATANAFLRSGLERLDDAGAAQSFWSIIQICNRPGPQNWCWQSMDQLVRARPNALVALDYARQLASREGLDELEQARVWAADAARLIEQTKMNEEDGQWLLDFAKLAEAKALHGLGTAGDEEHLPEAERLFTDLLESPGVEQEAALSLASLLMERERWEEAENLLTAALENWPEMPSLYTLKIFSQVLTGNLEGARSTSSQVLQKAGITTDSRFVAALGQILTETEDWELRGREFLQTDHEYVPYIAMMLYAKMQEQEEARALLETRWEDFKERRSQWSQRLAAGDATAWREMLIGCFLDKGEVEFERIVFELEDESSYEQSDLRHLPMHRRGLLTEAYFYDAMLARANDNESRYRASLQKVIDTDYRRYFEYKMAKFLLTQGEE